MSVEWTTIKEFPNYMVSSYGDIMNDDTGRIIRRSETKQGDLKVGLVSDHKQHTRSVKVLVAEAFVPGKSDIYNTPICLDNDRYNLRADNLEWRPRWFAWKYTRQFEFLNENDYMGPVEEIKSGDVYRNVYEAGIINGLLFRDIRNSMFMKITVFPTFQQFELR